MFAYVETLSWFPCIVISTFLYGALNFIYKLAAKRGLSSSQVVNRSAITVVLWSAASLLITGTKIVNLELLLFYSFLNSSTFALSATSKLSSLKYIPTSYFFPISKMSLVIVILLSLLFLGEMPLWNQWIGISLIFVIIYLVSSDSKKGGGQDIVDLKKGALIALGVVFGSGFSVFFGKLASTRVDRLSYIFFSYLMTMAFTYLLNRFQSRRVENRQPANRYVYIYGAIIGTLNFFGFVLVLRAFAVGPLSLIQSVSSIAIVIPIFLSVVFLKEDFNWRKMMMLVTAVGATLLIKLKL